MSIKLYLLTVMCDSIYFIYSLPSYVIARIQEWLERLRVTGAALSYCKVLLAAAGSEGPN